MDYGYDDDWERNTGNWLTREGLINVQSLLDYNLILFLSLKVINLIAGIHK